MTKRIILFFLYLTMFAMMSLPTNVWGQSPPSDCTTPTGASGQSDNNTSGDAGNCYQNAKDLQYNVATSVRGYLQTILTPKDHTDVYYFDYGQSSLDLNTNYCAEFTSPSGSPSPIPLADMTFRVWKGTYGSSSAPTFVGTVSSSQGVGFNPTSKARYFFSIVLNRDNTGGQYAFVITKKNCGGSSTTTPQLDYEPTAAYKNDTYSSGSGISQTDGKGVALRQSSDPFPLGTGGNSTTVSGSTFSFIVRSNVQPALASDLKLYLRKRGGSWQNWTMNEHVSFTAPSNDPVPYRFYVYVGCSTSASSVSIGPGTDYQYYFQLTYNNQSIYLPSQAATGTYLDAPDCVLSTDQEAPESQSQSPMYDNTGTINVSFTAQDGPTGSASGVKETALWYRKDGGPWQKAPNSSASGTSGSFSFSAQGEGKYDFYTQSTDNQGNTEAAPTSSTPPDSSTIFDKTPPSGLLAPPNQGIVGQPVNIGYTSSDAGSGVAEVEMWVRHNNGTWTRVTTSQNSGGLFPFTPNQPGTYDFFLRVKDKAGNWSSPTPSSSTFPQGTMTVTAPPSEQAVPEEDSTPDAGQNNDSPDASEPITPDTNSNNNNNTNSNNNNTNSNNNTPADAGGEEEPAGDGDGEGSGLGDGGSSDSETATESGSDGGVGEQHEPSSGESATGDSSLSESTGKESPGTDTSIQEQGTTGQESQDCNPPCASGFRCDKGRCVEYNCYQDGCPAGQICRNGACLSDPCDSVRCSTDMFCRDGQCVRSCAKIQCQDNELCVDGTCLPNRCYQKTCQNGTTCCPVDRLCKQSGQCEPDPCGQAQCPSGRICSPYTGQCVDDPCREIRCPNQNERCELGQCRAPKPPPSEGDEQEPNSEGSGSTESTNPEPTQDATTSDTMSADTSSSETTSTTENISQDSAGSVDVDNGVVIPNNPDQSKAPVGCSCSHNQLPFWSWIFFLGIFFFLRITAREKTKSIETAHLYEVEKGRNTR